MREAFERQVLVIDLDEARGLYDHLTLPTGSDGLGLRTELHCDAFHDAVDHAYESVIQAGRDAAHRVRTDQFLRLAKVHHRQAGSLREQPRDRHPDTRTNHAAQEFLVLRYDVEIDGGAQVDHNARASILREPCHRIHQPIRAHLAWIVIAHRYTKVDRGCDEHRLAAEVSLAHGFERLIHRRHHARDDHVVYRAQIQLREREQVADEDAPLVGKVCSS